RGVVVRRVVEEEVTLLQVLAVVALVVREPEQPFLEKRIAAVPEREREADMLMPIAQAREAVLVPAERARARVIVRKVIPRIAVGAVVLADGAPRPFGHVRTPALPVRAPFGGVRQTLPFGGHSWRFTPPPTRRRPRRPRRSRRRPRCCWR